jgi:hypothetical protein
MRNSYNIFAGNPEGKRPLGRTRRRWDDNIRLELKETVGKCIRLRIETIGWLL